MSGTNTVTVLTIDGSNPTGYSQVLEVRSSATAAPSMTYVLGADVIGQIAGDANAELQVLLYDGHGSVRGLLTATGAVMTNGSGQQEVYDYDAFGVSLPTGLTANAAATRLQFSGEWWDYGLQMSDNRARPYDPATGRFPIRDMYEGTIDDPQSLHRHLYTHGDPVMGIDPTGFSALSLSFGLGPALIDAGIRFLSFGPYEAAAAFVGVGAYLAIGALSTAQAAQGLVQDWLSSGEAPLVQAATLLVSQTQVVVDAIDDAIQGAVKAGRGLLRDLSNLPIFPIIESMHPDVYALDVSALTANPQWFLLTYNGPYSLTTAANRAAVWLGHGYKMLGANAGDQLDEFPYASTNEGGIGNPLIGLPAAWAEPVPAIQNQVQGGLLSAFYRYSLKGAGGRKFLVAPIPL